MSRAYSHSLLRTGLFAAIGALCLLCITVTTTFASTVNVYDNAGVLNQSQVRNEASSLSYPIDIYTTNNFGGSTSSFDQTTVSKINKSNLIVIAIDTAHHHLAIVGGRSVSLSNSQYTDARNAFSSNFHNNDYTSATIAAVDSLRSASSSGLSVPGMGSSGGGIGFGTLCCIGLLVLAALAVFGVIAGRRRRGSPGFFNRGFNRGPVAPPYNPNYNQYNQPYPPNYGPGYPNYNQNQGMNPLAAGGLGAAAGGLLGYELGKEQGEREEDRRGDDGGFGGGNNDGGGFGGGSSGDFGGGNNDGGGFGGGSSGDFGGGDGGSGGGGDFGGGGDSGGGSSGSF